MSDLNVYNLGQQGVNVDSSQIHKVDGELQQAQNLIQNVNGVRGGITNRPSLQKHNDDDLGSSVLGGHPLATPDTSGDLQAVTVYWPGRTALSVAEWWAIAGLPYPQTFVHPSRPTTWQSNAPAAIETPFGTPAGFRVGNRVTEYLGRIYYPGAHTAGTTSPTLFAFNGVDDLQVATITPAATLWINFITVTRGRIFVGTVDSGTTDADWVSRIFEVDTATGQLTLIGTALAAGYYASCCCIHNNDLYVGTGRTTQTNSARIYRIRLGIETTWTLELTLATDLHRVDDLISFKGLLYAGTKANNVSGTTRGQILRQTALLTWATVDTTTNAGGRGGAYHDLEIHAGVLYAISNYADGANPQYTLRRSVDGTTWTSAANKANFIVNANLLRSIGRYLFVGNTDAVYFQVDPTTGGAWANLLAHPSVAGGGNGNYGSMFNILRP